MFRFRRLLPVLLSLTLAGGLAACSTADADTARPRGKCGADQSSTPTLPDSAATNDSTTRAITPNPYRAALSLLTSPEE